MKISTILILIFIMLAVVATIAEASAIYFNVEKQIRQLNYDKLEAISYDKESSIKTFLEGQEYKIKLIATQSELTNEELKQMVVLDDSFYDMFVIDSKGVVIVSSNSERIGLDRANRSYFINARNQTYINPVYFALVPQEYSIAVSTPFHGGVLVASMKLDALSRIVSDRTSLGNTGESLLAFLDEKGDLIYFSDRRFSDVKIETVSKNDAVSRPIYRALLGEESLMLGLKDYRDVEVISMTNYLESINIGMVNKIDKAEAIDIPRNNLIKIFFIIGILLVIFVSFAGFLISRFISKPIKKLKNDVNEITKGKLDIQLSKSRVTEIQSLIDSLNRILATMKLAILRTGISKSELGLGEAIKAKEEAEEKYKLLYETSLDARMILEPPSWKFTSGNPATLRMFNLKDEKQFVNLTSADLSPEKQSDGQLSSVKSKKMIDKAIKEGSAFFEWTHKRCKGESFPTTVLLSRVKEGNKTYLQATVRDMTSNKEIEEKYKMIFDNSNDAIFIHDLEGHFLEVNKTACDRLGYTKNEFLKLSPQNIDSPKYAKLVKTRVDMLKKKGSIIFDSAHITKSGKEIPVEISSKVINYQGAPAVLSLARQK